MRKHLEHIGTADDAPPSAILMPETGVIVSSPSVKDSGDREALDWYRTIGFHLYRWYLTWFY